MKNIEKRILEIEKRNKKVETDKAWETSLTRKIIICVLTYLTVTLFFYTAKLPKPLINSIIPAIGFILSTLSLPLFKRMWTKKQ